MSLDGIVTRAIVNELKTTILGGKIHKIYQHEKDEISINIYNKGKNNRLIISASANNPRIHLTNQPMSNPATPPMFCMLLRKHLTRGTVLNIDQFHTDRVIFIDISSIDELGQPTKKRLIIEIMGRHSNIILIDQKSGNIIDSIKRITYEISRIRQVLPGIKYEYPKMDDKLNPLYLNKEEFYKLLEKNNKSTKIHRFFYMNYLGLGPLIGKEICFLSDVDIDRPVGSLSIKEKESLFKSFISMINIIKENDFKPILIKDNYGANFIAFYAIDINQFGHNNKLYLDSISEVLDKYYTKNDKLDRVSQKSKAIKKSIQTKLDRSLKKLSKQKHELLESKNREKYKIYADLISANIHKIERGVDEVELENFYTETMEKIKIPIDRKLSPPLNAQKYYKKYSKLKNAHFLLLKQIPDTKDEIEYLENVLNSIDHCTEPIELDEIKEELIKEGYLKGRIKKRKKKETISKPYHYLSSDGFDIYVGKNNRQNDYLTLKFAHREDLWLHVQNMPGSHVIIKHKNNGISDISLEEAAILAAYYSKGKNSTNVPVDYTERKNVKKPRNAKTGMVIYENFNTIFVTPNQKQIQKMKKVDD